MKFSRNLVKEYNIIAIISFCIAIVLLFSSIIGAIILLSYLKLCNATELFIPLLEQKILYAIAFVAIIWVVVIIIYSTFSAIMFIYDNSYQKEYIKPLKKQHIFDIIIFNILFVTLFSNWVLLESYPIKQRGIGIISLNFFSAILLSFLIWYISKSWENQRSYITNKISFIINKLAIFLIPALIGIITLLIGIKVKTINNDLQVLFLYLIFPILLSTINNIAILSIHSKKGITISFLSIFIVFFLWIIPIYHSSPIIIDFLGMSNKIEKTYRIKSNKKEEIESGRIVLNLGEKIIFLPSKYKEEYSKSIILERKNIELED